MKREYLKILRVPRIFLFNRLDKVEDVEPLLPPLGVGKDESVDGFFVSLPLNSEDCQGLTVVDAHDA